jgi:hypothetical protein
MLSRIKAKIKQIDIDSLRKNSLEYLSDFALRYLKLQATITIPVVDLILRARKIDTSVDYKKMFFDRMKRNMIWCIENRNTPDDSNPVRTSGDELMDVYVEPITRSRSPQTAGTSLFAGEDAIKKAQQYIIDNNLKRKASEAMTIEVSAVKVPKTSKSTKRRPSGKKSNRKSK